MKQKGLNKKRVNASLAVLWIGALPLIAFMFYGWMWPPHDKPEFRGFLSGSKRVFVDQLLLSRKDLQLGDRVNLININLSKEMNHPVEKQDSFMKASAGKKQVYSKILQSKLKKASYKQHQYPDGFIVKPLPLK